MYNRRRKHQNFHFWGTTPLHYNSVLMKISSCFPDDKDKAQYCLEYTRLFLRDPSSTSPKMSLLWKALQFFTFILLNLYSLSESMQDVHCWIQSKKIPIQKRFRLDVGLVARTPFDKLLSACRHPVCSAPFIHYGLECVPYYCTTSYSRRTLSLSVITECAQTNLCQSCHHTDAMNLWGYWSRGLNVKVYLFLV